MPVFPLVASSSTLPGPSAPDRSAVSMMLKAARSLTEPPGLAHSALPRISICGRCWVRLSNRSSGVLPTRARGVVPCEVDRIMETDAIFLLSTRLQVLGSTGYRRHNSDGVARLHGSISLFEIANVFVVQIDIHERAQASI